MEDVMKFDPASSACVTGFWEALLADQTPPVTVTERETYWRLEYGVSLITLWTISLIVFQLHESFAYIRKTSSKLPSDLRTFPATLTQLLMFSVSSAIRYLQWGLDSRWVMVSLSLSVNQYCSKRLHGV